MGRKHPRIRCFLQGGPGITLRISFRRALHITTSLQVINYCKTKPDWNNTVKSDWSEAVDEFSVTAAFISNSVTAVTSATFYINALLVLIYSFYCN